VNYIVEGSGQKYGNTIRLRVQLIDARHDKHLWAKSYENEIKETRDIFSIQSQVAQAIAGELKAIITPEEKKLIEKTPGTSLTAYDFYQRGRDEHIKYRLDNSNIGALVEAVNFYNKALRIDSTFARAYAGLAIAYVDKNSFSKTSYFSKNYLDSTLILADRALKFDNQLAEAYYARSAYYFFTGKTEQATREGYKALDYNPNYWEIYRAASIMFLNDINNLDIVKGIESLHKAVNINRGKELPFLLRDLGLAYIWNAGFPEKGNYYNIEALKLDNDSASYFNFLAKNEWLKGNFKGAIVYYSKCYRIDNNNKEYSFLMGECNMFAGIEKESLKYYKEYDERLKVSGELRLGGLHRIGYAYWKNGFKKESEYYFGEQKKQCEESIKKNLAYANMTLGAYYDLAGVSAFMGEKEKALQNLREWSKIPVCPLWWLTLLKNDPLFDNIKNEPGFLQIVKEMESKYQLEHERIKKWLIEHGMM
jgi:Flp pilus assembly protein TadD